MPAGAGLAGGCTGVTSPPKFGLKSPLPDISLGAPNNSSPAVKSLQGTTSINGLIYPFYFWTQLTYSGSSWNDDSLIHPYDNTTTMLDTAGNTVLVGTAVGMQPIGWEAK